MYTIVTGVQQKVNLDVNVLAAKNIATLTSSTYFNSKVLINKILIIKS